MTYHIRTEAGVEFGPVTANQLRDGARAGTISRRDLVRPDGSVDWFRADKVRGLDFSAEIVVADGLGVKAETPQLLTPPQSLTPPQLPVARANPNDALLRHIEPLVLRGFNVRKLEGEEVVAIDTQTFLDTFRVSIAAALIGRRGILVLTNRRLFIANATISTRSLQSVYLERIDRLGFGGRISLAYFLIGILLALTGSAIAFGSGVIAVATGGAYGLAPNIVAVPLVAIGVILILLARLRALEIGVASANIIYAKRSLDFDTLARIDEARDAAITSRSG
ncbi:MAG: DUF4339 domain-containing protein [Planctomycetota bacterium]|jgi:hypothetical protein|nr:MAG: DUF4339 domain-containing protein [Planctomycetota bacterium]